MTWKPHWCHQAQEIAAGQGWIVREVADGQMAFTTADHAHEVIVDLGEANELAAAADKAAADAIAKAAIAMPTKAEPDPNPTSRP